MPSDELQEQGRAATRPNIVFFMVDQLGQKWLETAFAGVCPTPNIDRLRSRGTMFTRAFTSNPVCSPTRSTIATGLTTRGHGVLENGYRLSPELPTFMRILQSAGWRTGALGKVHLRAHYESLCPDFRPYGFDVFHGTEDSRGGEWLDWAMKRFPEHVEGILATVWASDIPGFSEYGADRIDLADRIRRIRGSFDWATAAYPQNTWIAHTLPFPEEASQTCWITGHAIDFITGTPADQPLYAHISYVQPHSPFSAPERLMSRVDADRIPQPVRPEWPDDPNAPRELKRRKVRTDKSWRHARHCYFADITHLDEQLGTVLDSIEAAGRLENTFVVFLSDHGEMLYDHGFLGKEEKHYDACIRVPLIIAGPGIKRDQVRNEFVQLEDVCPTVLDMAGQSMPAMPSTGEFPKGEIPVLPGRSLLPLCRGEDSTGRRDAAYCESYNFVADAHLGQWARTILSDGFRYTCYADGCGEQMFDLANDPNEQNNVVGDPAYAGTRTRLRDRLMELIIAQDYPKTRRQLYSFGAH